MSNVWIRTFFHSSRSIVSCRKSGAEFPETQSRGRPVTDKEEKSNNLLRHLYPWKTKAQFAQHIASSVLYHQDGLVAINKPYGVPLRKVETTIGPNESPFAIEEVLCDLASHLKVNKILPVKSTERYTSGVMLFASHDDVKEKIQASLLKNRSLKIPTLKYLAVTINQPQPLNLQEVAGVGSFTHEDRPGKLPIIIKEYSKKKVEAGLVTEFFVSYKTLSSGTTPACSLVEMDVHTNKNHFIRVYLAHRLSPVLGDHVYGNRVHDVLGVKLAISPLQADSLSTFQKIPKQVLDLLKVSSSSEVPTCLHLKQLTLAKFNKKEDLVLTAEPPPHFKYVLERACLM